MHSTSGSFHGAKYSVTVRRCTGFCGACEHAWRLMCAQIRDLHHFTRRLNRPNWMVNAAPFIVQLDCENDHVSAQCVSVRLSGQRFCKMKRLGLKPIEISVSMDDAEMAHKDW